MKAHRETGGPGTDMPYIIGFTNAFFDWYIPHCISPNDG